MWTCHVLEGVVQSFAMSIGLMQQSPSNSDSLNWWQRINHLWNFAELLCGPFVTALSGTDCGQIIYTPSHNSHNREERYTVYINEGPCSLVQVTQMTCWSTFVCLYPRTCWQTWRTAWSRAGLSTCRTSMEPLLWVSLSLPHTDTSLRLPPSLCVCNTQCISSLWTTGHTLKEEVV